MAVGAGSEEAPIRISGRNVSNWGQETSQKSDRKFLLKPRLGDCPCLPKKTAPSRRPERLTNNERKYLPKIPGRRLAFVGEKSDGKFLQKLPVGPRRFLRAFFWQKLTKNSLLNKPGQELSAAK
jgi:hypothetical protein